MVTAATGPAKGQGRVCPVLWGGWLSSCFPESSDLETQASAAQASLQMQHPLGPQVPVHCLT